MSKIEEFLTFHSLRNDVLRDEVILLCSSRDANECKNIFLNIRGNLFPTLETSRIQELCVSKGIDTQIDYSLLRLEVPELPEDPRPANTTWYDYLHPANLKASSFVKLVLNANNIRLAHKYDEWRNTQPPEIKINLPSIQNINDGYFGAEYSDFNTLLNVPV